jgi:hypothetical protein
MNQDYGIPSPGAHHAHEPHRAPARYLVVLDAGGASEAQLFDATRTLSAKFDAGSEEVAVMTRGLRPVHGASGTEWDAALAGRSPAERAAAEVYTLDV